MRSNLFDDNARWIRVGTDILSPDHPLHPASTGEEACRLAAWIDLLGMARWRPGKGLNRGELRASVRFLASRWNWSKWKVGSFLSGLEEEALIERRPGDGPTAAGVIRIREYEALMGEPDAVSARTTRRETGRPEVVGTTLADGDSAQRGPPPPDVEPDTAPDARQGTGRGPDAKPDTDQTLDGQHTGRRTGRAAGSTVDIENEGANTTHEGRCLQLQDTLVDASPDASAATHPARTRRTLSGEPDDKYGTPNTRTRPPEGAEGSSLGSSPSGASADRHDPRDKAWNARLAPLLRETAYLSEDPPNGHSLARCLSKAHQLLDRGYRVEDLEDAIRGLRLMAERRDPRVRDWIEPDDQFRMLAFGRAEEQGERLVQVAAHEWRKAGGPDASGSRKEASSVGDVLSGFETPGEKDT